VAFDNKYQDGSHEVWELCFSISFSSKLQHGKNGANLHIEKKCYTKLLKVLFSNISDEKLNISCKTDSRAFHHK